MTTTATIAHFANIAPPAGASNVTPRREFTLVRHAVAGR
jgi:hypothetical protein